MSMIANFYLLSEDDIRTLMRSPSSVETLIDAAYKNTEGRFIDINMAWHGLHFLLTGTAWEGTPPLDFIVRGGMEIGEDMGNGRARQFYPDEVAQIALALAPITRHHLPAKFDAKQMETLAIYPSGNWSRIDPNSEESFGYFSGAFDDLKRLMQKGQAERLGLLVWLA